MELVLFGRRVVVVAEREDRAGGLGGVVDRQAVDVVVAQGQPVLGADVVVEAEEDLVVVAELTLLVAVAEAAGVVAVLVLAGC